MSNAMPHGLIILLPKLTILLFIFATGACVGSLINVLVYRMPLGLNVITPASRCPSCNTKLTWRENIPILGWLLLRGKCRFCKSKISPEYPIVESIVALLFAGTYALWYMVKEPVIRRGVIEKPGTELLGIEIWRIAPEWTHNGAAMTWPALVVLLVLIGSLVAMTIIDARTCMIPLTLTRVPVAVALIFTVGHAIWFQSKVGELTPIHPGMWDTEHLYSNGSFLTNTWWSAPSDVWTLATGGLNGWGFIGISIGGVLGLVISNAFLKMGVLTQSFADYDEWAEAEFAKRKTEQPLAASEDSEREADPELTEQMTHDGQEQASESDAELEDNAEMWIQYPHARREMVRELAFLMPPAALAMIGGWAFKALVIGGTLPATAPLWLVALGGVLMGYLIGGAVVWAVRIFGSLAFGKEAMGLGDVHMMAAVGACLGWIDPTIAFFLAAFVGVAYAIAAKIFSGKLTRAMPYGPFLAVATLLVIFGKPLVEMGLGAVFHSPGGLNIP